MLSFKNFLTKEYTEDEVKNEPMVYSADATFAWNNGGAITKAVLKLLVNEYDLDEEHTVIDTRVHMLKPGWFPSIPGWHCDAIPRNSEKIPDLDHPQIPLIRHYLCVVDAGTDSLTEFLVKKPENLPKVAEGENLWGLHSRLIKESIAKGDNSSFKIMPNALYEFDAMEYHNTTPAEGHGFRFFFRASVNTLTRGPYNEVRNQVQTYLPYEDLGW